MEVAGIRFDDITIRFRVTDFFKFGQQPFPVGSQALFLHGQLFKFFLDQIDDVGILGNLIHEPHGRLNLAISRDDFFLHSLSLSHKIGGLGPGGPAEIVFNTIQVACTKQNLGQVIDDRLLDFLGSKALHLAMDGLANDHLVAVVTVGPVLAVGGLTNQGPATVTAA